MRRCASVLACGLAVWSLGCVAASRVAAAPQPPKPRPQPRAHPTLNPALPQGTRLLVVRTVPALVGARFTFASTSFGVTDESGTASLLIASSERDVVAANRNRVLGVATPSVDVSPSVRAVFTGWSGSGAYVDGVMTETATFRTEYLTQLQFTNRQGRAVPASRVGSVELAATSGARITARAGDAVWLTGRAITTGPDGPTTRAVTYAITRVDVAGSNVVNSGQQRVVPSLDARPTVRLLLYTVRFVGRDALLRSHVGSRVHLRHPDGSVTEVAMHSGGTVVRDLPRGSYDVTIEGGTFAMTRPLSISRDQTAEIDAVSYVDVALIAIAVALAATAVFVVGRRLRRPRRLHGWRGSEPEPGAS